MNRSAKGSRNEHRTMEFLKKEGYYPIRSAGSHGAFDVVGVYIGEQPEIMPLFRMIQSKTGGSFSEKDFFSLRILRTSINTVVAKAIDANKDSVAGMFSVITPRLELHNWEKHRRAPTITILGSTREEDYKLY